MPEGVIPTSPLTGDDLTPLLWMQRQFPTVGNALAEIVRLSARLHLPRPSIHVISDIHGDDQKLRHVINNASGTLRPIVEELFQKTMSPDKLKEFITLIFYPRETLEMVEPTLVSAEERKAFSRQTLDKLLTIVRHMARSHTLFQTAQHFPSEYRDLLVELLIEPNGKEQKAYHNALIESLLTHDRAFSVIRQAVRVVRDLAIDELIIAGDLWDRGPRGDRVVDYLMHQPGLSFIWGNHDAAWLGACLGHAALIMHVLRISLRYRNMRQLEEGYGITLGPLEVLVNQVYASDPALCFKAKGTGLRDPLLVARMQKAAAMMQFKLEGQMILRNPQWGLEQRRLLHTIDLESGTISIEGTQYRLRDTSWPTLDPRDPYALSPEEQAALENLQASFRNSQKLWQQMNFLVNKGSMYLVRDDNLIFHGCVPVDSEGNFLPLLVDGKSVAGREMFEALHHLWPRVFRRPTLHDLDLLWYLWCGPLSPLFGKDKITTLENDLIEDPATHVETKNPYFSLIHQVDFCDKILCEFGCDPERGLIVNGHVPVRIEKGESPMKRSGKAITIDGAFSEAYGDQGYTLVLEPEYTLLARHQHFASVKTAVMQGLDIIPEVTEIRRWESPRKIGDSEEGDEIRREIDWLQKLVWAYQTNQIRQLE